MSIKIYLEEERRSQFKAICALENLSMNEVLLGLLEDWLEKHALPMTSDRTAAKEETLPAAKSKQGNKKETTKP